MKDFIGKPLAVSIKKNGSQVMLSKSLCVVPYGIQGFDSLKNQYTAVKDKIPDWFYLFGEWSFVDSTIEIFAVYKMSDQLFLSSREVNNCCKALNFPIVETIKNVSYDLEWQLTSGITEIAEEIIRQGQDGIVVRSIYPFHYTEFDINVAQYVKK